MLHQKHNTTCNRLHEKNASTMAQKGDETALFPTVSCPIRNIKSKNILSKAEREQVMAYVSAELFNECPLQYSTASIRETEMLTSQKQTLTQENKKNKS